MEAGQKLGTKQKALRNQGLNVVGAEGGTR